MISAFIIGLAGSLHCVGMCGPLMISLNSNGSRKSFASYHTGRLLVYSGLGLAFGIVGQGLALLEVQRVLAIIMGVFIIILYAVPSTRIWIEKQYYESIVFASIRKKMNSYFSSGSKWFVAGVLNGLIPCGLIYLALAGSLLLAKPLLGMGFMFLFGLGTLPALILISFFEALIPEGRKRKFSSVYSVVAIVAGGILVFRGLADYPSINEYVQMSMSRVMSLCGL
jgi:sulfite exporter TauE/SafE